MSSRNAYLTQHPELEKALHALTHGVAKADTGTFLKALDGFIERATAEGLTHEGEFGMHQRGAAVALRQVRSLFLDADLKKPDGAKEGQGEGEENPLGGTY